MTIKQTITTFLSSILLSCTACAGPSSQHLSESSEHGALASTHGSSAAIKGTASVAAVPLLIVGSTGVAVGAAGSTLVDFASKPLPLGDDTELEIPDETPDPATVLGNQRAQ